MEPVPPWPHIETKSFLAVMVVLLFGGITIAVMFGAIPTANMDLAKAGQTTLGLMTMAVIGYYFGSSQSSATKDATISSALADKPKG